MVQYIDSTVHKLYLDKNRVVSPLGSGVGGGGGGGDATNRVESVS